MRMKIEYLLVKTNNDFCSTADQFKNLLMSNKRITMTDDSINFSNTTLEYTLSATEVNWKKNKEIVFYFMVSSAEEDVEILENFDLLIHRINENCGQQFLINTIWDDVSIFYTNKLYSSMVEVENLLRKLIYRFMIKTAGSAWFDSTVPAGMKDAIKKTADKNHMDELPTEDQLYYADFIQLGWFFFEKYTTKPLNQNSVQELRNIIGEKDKIEEKLRDFLETYEAKSNWERYFKEEIEVEDLYQKWQELYTYRNHVAHAKQLKHDGFKKAKELISELKEAFEKCLDHIDSVEMTEEQAEAVQEVAQETISRPQKVVSHTDAWAVKYPGIMASVSGLGKAAALASSQFNESGLNEGVVQMLGQRAKLPDGFLAGKESLLVGEKIAAQFQPTANLGELLVKPSYPYLGAFDTLKIATEPLYTMPDYAKILPDASGVLRVSEPFTPSAGTEILNESIVSEEKTDDSDENIEPSED